MKAGIKIVREYDELTMATILCNSQSCLAATAQGFWVNLVVRKSCV